MKLETGSEVLQSQGEYWRLSVRRSAINPAYSLCSSYQTYSDFTALNPDPKFNYDREPYSRLSVRRSTPNPA